VQWGMRLRCAPAVFWSPTSSTPPPALAARVTNPNIFRSGREFAAWLGLVPRQNSTGGKARLGGISKRGDGYLRRLLVNSAHTVLLCSKQAKTDPWLTSLLSRKPRLVAAVALANKTARVAWAIMSRQDTYDTQQWQHELLSRGP
jgi:transposase